MVFGKNNKMKLIAKKTETSWQGFEIPNTIWYGNRYSLRIGLHRWKMYKKFGKTMYLFTMPAYFGLCILATILDLCLKTKFYIPMITIFVLSLTHVIFSFLMNAYAYKREKNKEDLNENFGGYVATFLPIIIGFFVEIVFHGFGLPVALFLQILHFVKIDYSKLFDFLI